MTSCVLCTFYFFAFYGAYIVYQIILYNKFYLFARALKDKELSNLKLYTVGAHSAIVTGDTALLEAVTSKLIRDWNKYPEKNAQTLLPFTAYLPLHCCVLNNDYRSALPFYKLSVQFIKKSERETFRMKTEGGYRIYLYRNMALTAAYHGMRKEALEYLDKYFLESDRLALKNIGYYTAMALKAQLTEDKKLLREALENIVRIDPGLTRYAQDLEKLKKEENKQ